MVKCQFCGKEVYLPYRCKYCGGVFCYEHRLPEAHACSAYTGEEWDIPVKVKRRRPAVRVKIPRLNLAAYGYNNIIIAVCTILFVLSLIFPIDTFLALDPRLVIFMPWQLITSIFLHASFDHYLVNMLVLFFFGSELERRVGSKTYLNIFLISGLAGNLAYILFAVSTGQMIPALGASGAIFGVMGTLAIIAPEIRVLLFFFIPMSIRMAIILFALWDLVMLPLSMQTGVAHIAHLAGLVTGVYYGRRLKYRIREYFRWW